MGTVPEVNSLLHNNDRASPVSAANSHSSKDVIGLSFSRRDRHEEPSINATYQGSSIGRVCGRPAYRTRALNRM